MVYNLKFLFFRLPPVARDLFTRFKYLGADYSLDRRESKVITLALCRAVFMLKDG